MKMIDEEFQFYQKYKEKHLNSFPKLSGTQEVEMKNSLLALRKWRKNNLLIHNLLELLPLIILFFTWLSNLIFSGKIATNFFVSSILTGIIHGFIGYSFVVYTLHEAAGHGLFRNIPLLSKLAFHLPRLKMADPEYYQACHIKHHKYLGKFEDCAFTHHISQQRFLRSIIPGAGILFSNDYNIHQNPIKNKSRYLSEAVGLLFLVLEVYLVSRNIGVGFGLLALVGISPWVGFVLDRFRETIEHRHMPDELQYGSRELGFNLFSLIIGGGPWGQMCHFSHHYAPDLPWYQQIMLHLKLRGVFTSKQKEFYFFNIYQFLTKKVEVKGVS